MKSSETAVLLIGYQKDWFDVGGKLYGILEESIKATKILDNTDALITDLAKGEVEILSIPLHFSSSYFDMDNPEGILKAIKGAEAFLEHSEGAEAIPEIEKFGDRVKEIPGKKGMNAFSNTHLDEYLKSKGIKNIIIAGAVTSLCVDTSARFAYGLGYHVVILSDCIAARSNVEQDFYCENIFPLYSNVTNSRQVINQLQ